MHPCIHVVTAVVSLGHGRLETFLKIRQQAQKAGQEKAVSIRILRKDEHLKNTKVSHVVP
jgi:hypothetical protein